MDYILLIGAFISFWLGSRHMNHLLENPNTNIQKLNLKFAIGGCLFGGLSLLNLGLLSIVSSFIMGVFFGLIGVSLIFEKIKK